MKHKLSRSNHLNNNNNNGNHNFMELTSTPFSTLFSPATLLSRNLKKKSALRQYRHYCQSDHVPINVIFQQLQDHQPQILSDWLSRLLITVAVELLQFGRRSRAINTTKSQKKLLKGNKVNHNTNKHKQQHTFYHPTRRKQLLRNTLGKSFPHKAALFPLSLLSTLKILRKHDCCRQHSVKFKWILLYWTGHTYKLLTHQIKQSHTQHNPLIRK